MRCDALRCAHLALSSATPLDLAVAGGAQLVARKEVEQRIVADVGGHDAKAQQVLECVLRQKRRNQRHRRRQRRRAHLPPRPSVGARARAIDKLRRSSHRAAKQRSLVDVVGHGERRRARKARQLARNHLNANNGNDEKTEQPKKSRRRCVLGRARTDTRARTNCTWPDMAVSLTPLSNQTWFSSKHA